MPKPNIYELDGIGTHWWFEQLDGEISAELRHAIEHTIRKFDAAYTRFNDSSLTSQLCLTGTIIDPPAEMVAMMKFAREMFNSTNGVFNISVGGSLSSLGYGQSTQRGHVSTSFWQQTRISTDAITIPKATMLDFGGFGKGWLIDKLTTVFEAHGAKQYIINGGGDLFVNSSTPIEFTLEHPLYPTQKIGSTRMSRGALAASSTLKRTWSNETGSHHHLIDPATDQPSDSEIVACFVKADTALIADSMATVLIIDPTQDKTLAQSYQLQTILISRSQLDVGDTSKLSISWQGTM